MTKVRNPLLSPGAGGTIGDALTYQKRGRQHIVRQKPTPTDPYSLAQAYQRWDYQDYAYLWTLETEASKQTYRTRASRYHITGYSLWMREHLKDLPDLAGRWHLDEKAGAIAYDSSKYATHGTIIGASPTTGLIDGAQYFTLNDYIEITAPQLNFTSEDFSVVAKITLDDLTITRALLYRGLGSDDGWLFIVLSTGALYFETAQSGAGQASISSAGDIATAKWYTLGFSRSGASVRLYKNGVDVTATVGTHIDPETSTKSAKIGIHNDKTSYPWDGKIDDLITYKRALDAHEHLIHSQRRYPV